MAILLVFRTQVKIWKNIVKRNLVNYPLMVLLISLLMVGGIGFSWYGFIKFKDNVGMLKNELLTSDAIIEELVFNYITMTFLTILIISVFKKLALRTTDFPEVLKVCAFSERKIRNAFNLCSNSLLYLLILLYLTPISFVVIKLTGLGNPELIVSLILFKLYYISMFYLADIMFTTSQYLLFKFSPIRNKDLFTTLLGFTLLFVIAVTAVLFFSDMFYTYLPSGLLYKFIMSLQTSLNLPTLVYYFTINAIIIASIIMFSIVLNRLLKIDSDDTFSNKAFDIISFRHKYISHYLVLIVKRTFRNFDTLLTLLLFTLAYIGLALILRYFEQLSSYIFIFMQLTPIVFIAIIGFYILNFDDSSTQKMIFTYEKSLKEYNLLLNVFYTFLFYIWFGAISFIAFLILEMNDTWGVFFKNQYIIVIYVLIAVLYKNLLITGDSNILVRVITFYLYFITIGLMTTLISKTSNTLYSATGINEGEILNIPIIAVCSFALYYIQFFILDAKKDQAYV